MDDFTVAWLSISKEEMRHKRAVTYESGNIRGVSTAMVWRTRAYPVQQQFASTSRFLASQFHRQATRMYWAARNTEG